MTQNPQFDDVAMVNGKFGHAIRTTPGLHYPDVQRRFDFFIEEVDEMVDAFDAFKEAMDNGDEDAMENAILEFFDGAVDVLVTLYGVTQATGLPITEGLKIVTESNLSKLGDDGLPIYEVPGDSNTKVTKGPNYFKPSEGLLALLRERTGV